MRLSDSEVFQHIAKGVGGRELRRHLESYLAHEDAVSRKLRGEALLENTIRRQFIADFIACLNIEETQQSNRWE